MEDKKPQNDDHPTQITEVTKSVPKKGSNFKWILLIVFAAMIIRPFFKAKPPELAWQDYETGVKLAQEQDKPILLAFYKAGERFCTDMWANTYANKNAIKFIEDNFVPIFVDVVKQPNLAKEYKISYYPTHFIKTPDNKEIIKTRRGYDTPGQFRPFLLEGLAGAGKEPIQSPKN
jgi:thioredoxin-related protein